MCTCDQKVLKRGLSFARFRVCGRPAVESGKCRIHCESAVKAREIKKQETFNKNRKLNLAMQLAKYDKKRVPK